MTIYEDKISREMKGEKLEYLYFIGDMNRITRKHHLFRVPIIKETKQSYYVPKETTLYKTAKEWLQKYGEDMSRVYIVKKDTMKAKVSTIGDTHRQYYQHPFLAKESYFIMHNASAIGRALAQSKNPFLLRQIAHNLEMENLIELQYDDDINEKTEGENYATK